MTDKLISERVKLAHRLINDLRELELTPSKLHYELRFRNYSKTYYGRYERKNYYGEIVPIVIIYVYKNKDKTALYDYEDIISTVIHEICHHIQYSDENFVRKKGVMHNKQFWELYNKYMNLYFEKCDPEKKGARYFESIKKANRVHK